MDRNLARSFIVGTHFERMPEESANKFIVFFSSRIQTWVTIAALGSSSLLNVINQQPVIWKPALMYGVIVISFFLSLYANLKRMLLLDDPYFNSNAYKLFRKQEYYIFLAYFRENKYTFQTAYNWLELMYRENGLDSIVEEHRKIQHQWRDLVEELKRNLQEKDRSLEQDKIIIDELNKQIDLLQKLAKVNEDGFISAISTIYRLRSSDFLFNTSDLRVITDFSLFEFADYHMLYRVCEHGTTETPRIIDIDDPNYSHYSSVQLVQGTNTIEYATSDREGRTVASYWIELPSGRILIYNFHYDSTNKEMNAIIEMKEMYRYIKGICMHLEERGLLNRRGPHHAAN